MNFQKLFLPLVLVFAIITGCSPVNGKAPSSEQKEVLRLACWVSDLEIQSLVETYNNSQDKYKIEIISFFERGNDIQSVLDRMNIELATNNSFDLYYLDSLDTMRLSNAGLLADINEYINGDSSFSKDDFIWNIWKLFEKNGKLYEIIPNFQIMGVVGPISLLNGCENWTISSYPEFAKGKNITLYTNAEDMLSFMIQYSLEQYIDIEDGTCNFTTEEFYNWMKFIASFSHTDENAERLRIRSIDGIYDYAVLKDEYQQQPFCVGIPDNSGDNISARAVCSFAISSQTKHRDACWNFCKMLLSQDVQENIFCSFGFPINRAVLNSQLLRAQLPPGNGNYIFKNITSQSGRDIQPLDNNDIKYIHNIIDSTSSVCLRYDEIYEIIYEDMAKYLSGDATEEETATIIQNRVQIFLSERV